MFLFVEGDGDDKIFRIKVILNNSLFITPVKLPVSSFPLFLFRGKSKRNYMRNMRNILVYVGQNQESIKALL